MNIRCPACQTVFRVDPARVPPAGVRARCSRCSAAFLITAQGAAAAEAPPVAAAVPTSTPAAPAVPAPAAGVAPSPGGATAPAATRASEPAAPAAGGTAGGTEGAARPGVFGTRDPQARAQRIARALVSDIVAYHPRKRDDALANGTLRTEFRDEIMKSWEEYVAQVGSELAKSTPYFRNALNEILARGQRVF
jgi:predicted Zn finger-like uncharacterized protein